MQRATRQCSACLAGPKAPGGQTDDASLGRCPAPPAHRDRSCRTRCDVLDRWGGVSSTAPPDPLTEGRGLRAHPSTLEWTLAGSTRCRPLGLPIHVNRIQQRAALPPREGRRPRGQVDGGRQHGQISPSLVALDQFQADQPCCCWESRKALSLSMSFS